jgi:hypothetical protein
MINKIVLIVLFQPGLERGHPGADFDRTTVWAPSIIEEDLLPKGRGVQIVCSHRASEARPSDYLGFRVIRFTVLGF